ncbi:hypothetical protein I4F81_009453 [Pyropia yezoensis]|uniref:Uncharacterized protein n=1 Tax=Pyropia yezoensis TaxID=2788 RepID=A0ACC3C9F6_PYRYE|nr:hypothetical protein I4F81_009453 [Neopyropia yezoensis]
MCGSEDHSARGPEPTMKMCLSHLVATALAVLVVATVAPNAIDARAAKLLIFDGALRSKIKVRWATSILYGGRTLSTTRDETKVADDGDHEFRIPQVNSCGAIRASTQLGWVEIERTVGSCKRPSMDINSALTAPEGRVYCADTFYRIKSFWRTTCKQAGTLRAVLLDDSGSYMMLTRPGDFRLCGFVTNDERTAAEGAGAKKLSR